MTGRWSAEALVLPGLPGGLRLPSLPQALCKGADTEVWFPVVQGRGAAGAADIAKVVCAACPECRACLEWALAAGEAEGVWGGTTPAERAEIRRAGHRRKGAA